MEPKPHGGGAIAKLTASDLAVVKQLVETQPDAHLCELCERLAQNNQVNVSVPTMHRAVQSLDLSYKKKH